METKILNYRIVIEPDKETGTERKGFTAYCPTLGIADDGATVEESLKNLKSMIRFHLKCLLDEGEKIPEPDIEESFITNLKIEFPLKHFASL